MSGDQGKREPRQGEYLIGSVGCGSIVCVVPGLKLVDFYRTQSELAKDVKPKDKP